MEELERIQKRLAIAEELLSSVLMKFKARRFFEKKEDEKLGVKRVSVIEQIPKDERIKVAKMGLNYSILTNDEFIEVLELFLNE